MYSIDYVPFMFAILRFLHLKPRFIQASLCKIQGRFKDF